MQPPLHLHEIVPLECQRRLRWMGAGVGAAFLILIARLWQLQVVRGDYYFERSTQNFVKERSLAAVRGRIFDRRGTLLADSRPAFHVYASVDSYTPVIHQRLMQVLQLPEDTAAGLWLRVDKTKKQGQLRALLLSDVDRDVLALIVQEHLTLPGVEVVDVPHRIYPHGMLAAHVLGYLNQITEAELEAKRPQHYEPGDFIGRYGLERLFEPHLLGTKGVERHVVDAQGRLQPDVDVGALIEGDASVPPIPGRDLVLTLDLTLQQAAWDALEPHPAAGVAVVDIHDGSLLVLLSKPAFDPNLMTGRLTRTEEEKLRQDPHKPFLDKTLAQQYYPGSTFKLFTAIAALESGAVDPAEIVFCRGATTLGNRTFRCSHAHGPVTFTEALTRSCNVYFWTSAQRMGLDPISRVALDFGLGASTGIGLNSDLPGRIPSRRYYEEKHGRLHPGYIFNTAIGQGDTEVTVLQLALAYAAVANRGTLWTPRLVDRMTLADGTVVATFPPQQKHQVSVSGQTLEWVKRGLWGVVQSPYGTAHGARLPTVEVAGKTGTAQVRRLQNLKATGWHPNQDHAWFAGYAPARNPEIAFAVLVEHGGKGGQVAAPVAMAIVRAFSQTRIPEVAPNGSSKP